MGNDKNKRKDKQNSASKPLQSTNINLPENISAEKMQHIIACAIVEAEEIRVQKEEEQRKIALTEWHKTIGYKDYSTNKWYTRIPMSVLNGIKIFLKILFIPKNKIIGDKTTFALLKMFLEMFFGFAKIFTLLFSILVIAYIPLQYIVDTIPNLPIVQNVFWGIYAVLSFIFSRMFRMAAIEIDKIEDRNLLFGIFASITSIVSIIVAIIAVIK